MTEPAPLTSGLLGTLHRYRRPLVAIGALWLALVLGAGLFLSQLEARYGLRVFGPTEWSAGEPVTLRACLQELKFGTPKDAGPLDVTLETVEGQALPTATLSQTAGAFRQGAFTAPPPGRYRVEVIAHTADGPVRAEFGVQVEPNRAPSWPSPPPPPKPSKPDKGLISLDITPTDGVLPSGLTSPLTIRALDAQSGQPSQTTVSLTLLEGRSQLELPLQVQTDHLGLAHLAFQPLHPTVWFELNAPGDSAATRRLKPVSTQFVLTTPEVLLAPGAPLAFRLQSILREGPVFLDAWYGPRWIATTAGTLREGVATGTLALPELREDPALIWVQAYQSAYLPGKARGGRYLVISRRPRAEIAKWLAERISSVLPPGYGATLSAQASDNPRLVPYLLGRLGRPDQDPPILADSSDSARQTVSGLKSLWQKRFILTLLATGGLLFGVLGFLVWTNERQVRQAWHEAGGDEDGAQGGRQGALLEAGYLFGVLALFLFGLVQLLLSIRW